MAAQQTDQKQVQLKYTRIILFAQVLSVTASVTGLVGLVIAYRALTRSSATETPTTRVPTIM